MLIIHIKVCSNVKWFVQLIFQDSGIKHDSQRLRKKPKTVAIEQKLVSFKVQFVALSCLQVPQSFDQHENQKAGDKCSYTKFLQ